MKKNEITNLAANRIENYIRRGYTVSLTELTGSYGIYNQLVLVNGNSRVVVWMEDGVEREDLRVEYVELHVSQFELGKGESTEWGDYHWPRGWKEHDVKTYRAYKVDDDWYVTDYEEAKSMREKHIERYHVARTKDGYYEEVETTDKHVEIARRLKGFKTIKKDNLQVLKRHGYASWKFFNKTSRNQVTLSA